MKSERIFVIETQRGSGEYLAKDFALTKEKAEVKAERLKYRFAAIVRVTPYVRDRII